MINLKILAKSAPRPYAWLIRTNCVMNFKINATI